MEASTPLPNTDYSTWTQEALISRIRHLESSLESSSKKSDINRHATRLIALKFAYIGGPYQGLEYHTGAQTALPAVEEKLFEALLKSRLVPPRKYYNADGSVDTTQIFKDGGNSTTPMDIGKWIDLDKWEYTKCGRTDRGVSAFGQVVGIRVRSNCPKATQNGILGGDTMASDPEEERSRVNLEYRDISGDEEGQEEEEEEEEEEEAQKFDDKDELPYVTILNRLLPSTIRILAWCPNPPVNFSARFDCKARTYHYFFTNPPSQPLPGEQPNLLDIEAMRKAAKYYEGLQDFRNVCKLDPSKQITNFKRRVEETDIVKVGGVTPVFTLQPWDQSDEGMLRNRPEMYYFKLTGSAFLWHQVRHMVAILFLVGQRLEKPEVVRDLLDIQKIPTKPFYNMADDRPLVLWDCIFDAEKVRWVYPELSKAKKNSREDVLASLWEIWHNANMDAMLSGGLLATAYNQQEMLLEGGKVEKKVSDDINDVPGANKKRGRDSTWIVDGSPISSSFGKYVPIVERGRMDPVEVINRKFAARKSEEWRQKWSADAKMERGIGEAIGYDD
ncbi:hypothetical protein AA313_de0210208 [Arthrobotrys entomopaga]|nr:hypothetical protein AA313_de0210208 [Arthrobotrys entomopaga]